MKCIFRFRKMGNGKIFQLENVENVEIPIFCTEVKLPSHTFCLLSNLIGLMLQDFLYFGRLPFAVFIASECT